MNRVWLSLGLIVLAGCLSPIVGAECAEGFVLCDDRCVELDSNALHCGACGNVCAIRCESGVCIDGADTGVDADAGADTGDTGPDGALPDVGQDVDLPDADAGDAMDAGDAADAMDGGDTGVEMCLCDLGEACCGTSCVRLERDRRNCGECGNVCDADQFCAAGACEDVCEDPLALCGDLCVDLTIDRDHCGRCGNDCASGICRDGTCVGATEGHVVLIGHDYRTGREGQNYLAGNAVFIAFGDVQALVYEGDAVGFAITGVDDAIDQVASRRRRTWLRMEVPSAAEVPLFLDQSDVFVVYSQSGSDDTNLRRLGRDWSTALRSFLRRGGVIVVFDGGGAHSGTWQILDEAGLLDAGGRSDITGEELTVVSRGDTVARLVPPTYNAEDRSVAFESAPDGTVVVEHEGDPVVIHEVLSP